MLEKYSLVLDPPIERFAGIHQVTHGAEVV